MPSAAQSASNGAARDTTITSRTYVGFIDVLFAVVVGQSFALLRPGQQYYLCLEKPAENGWTIAVLILVYALVVSSWHFYHWSTTLNPIRSPIRFIIDIVLLFAYYLAFLSANHFPTVITIFLAIFIGYTLWDGVRFYEYRNMKQDMSRWSAFWGSISVTSLFTAFTIFTAFSFWYLTPMLNGMEWNTAYWVILIVILAVYRWAKLRHRE